jgi:putative Holliday junction resolvase
MKDTCIVGIDYGKRRIGVAVSDTQKKVAFPLAVIRRHGDSYGLERLKKLLGDRRVEYFVVGIPLQKNGSLSEEGCEVVRYVAGLKSFFDCEAVTWDESFTTVEAEEFLIEGGVRRERRKEVIDKVAAQIILQTYLDHVNDQ